MKLALLSFTGSGILSTIFVVFGRTQYASNWDALERWLLATVMGGLFLLIMSAINVAALRWLFKSR